MTTDKVDAEASDERNRNSDARCKIDDTHILIDATERAFQLGGGPPHMSRMATLFANTAIALAGAPFVRERLDG